MNLKHLAFLTVFIIHSFTGYSQHDPDKEILVFLTDGVTQQLVAVEGKKYNAAKIIKEELKLSLNSMGIVDSLIEVALPEYKTDTSNISGKLQVVQEPDMSRLYRIKVTENKNRKELIDKLNKLPEVLYAEINVRNRPAGDPIDVDFPQQWALKNTTNPGADIHAIGAWDIYKGNANNIIAIIDGGIPSGITDLAPKISDGDTGYGWDGHGGHVAGIAAAVTNNSLKYNSIAGVDWYAKVHPQRVDNGDAVSDYKAIIDAVNYSPNVHVLNHSWSMEDGDGNPVYSITVRQAIAYAYKKNRINIAASGNYQDTHPNATWYPVGYDNVMAVGATTSSDRILPLSSQGNYIDVSAPGDNIKSFYFNNTYSFSGTSQASPHVAGIASLLKGYNMNLANDDIENLIELSADDIENVGFDYASGFGRVNAERALQFLRTPYTFSQLSANSGTVYSTSRKEGVDFLGAPGLVTAAYWVKRIEVRKNVTFPKTYSRIIGVWGRGAAASSGWNGANPNFGEGYCRVVPGTLTNSGVTLATFVYQIWDTGGSYLGYFPASPASVRFSYTILAEPGISGPDNLCSSNATYTLVDAPSGQAITWSLSSNLQLISSLSNSITVKPLSGGPGWIKANLGSYSTEKELWVGIPYPPTSITNFCCNGMGFISDKSYIFSVDVKGATQFDWIVEGGSILYGQGTNSITVLTSKPIGQGISFNVSVRAGNNCGWSAYLQRGGYIPPVSGNQMFSVYPNPANSEIYITVSDTKSDFSNSNNDDIAVTKVMITDANGNLKYLQDFVQSQKTVKINVSGIQRGAYIITISNDSIKESHSLVIE